MGLLGGILESKNTSHFEGEFAGVDFVEGAIDDFNFHIDHRITGENAPFDGFFNAVNHRGNVFSGNRAADDFVFYLYPFTPLIRSQRDHRVAVLATATGLADKLAFTFGSFGDRLAI